MTIYEDTRQKIGEHRNIAEYCRQQGIIVRRTKLEIGDYISPAPVAVDTKQGMGEVYTNLVQQHDRFRNECIKAQQDGTQLVILIENDEGLRCLDDVERWDNPRVHEYYTKYAWALAAKKARKLKDDKLPAPPINNKRLIKMMETMTERYGVRWEFCSYEETGAKVVEILSG